MKSPTILQCDQCESETGNLVSSELDITYCAKIENARGRLVCTYRETKPTPTTPNDDENNKEETQVPDTEKKPVDPLETEDLDDNKDLDITKDKDDIKDKDDKGKKEDGDDDGEEAKKTEDKPLINPPIVDDTPLPEPNGENNGDYTDEFEHPNDGLPPGSFRKHCTGCELLKQGMLLACDFCKRNAGNRRYTIALVRDCKFFVSIDGTLRCDKAHSAKL